MHWNHFVFKFMAYLHSSRDIHLAPWKLIADSSGYIKSNIIWVGVFFSLFYQARLSHEMDWQYKQFSLDQTFAAHFLKKDMWSFMGIKQHLELPKKKKKKRKKMTKDYQLKGWSYNIIWKSLFFFYLIKKLSFSPGKLTL